MPMVETYLDTRLMDLDAGHGHLLTFSIIFMMCRVLTEFDLLHHTRDTLLVGHLCAGTLVPAYPTQEFGILASLGVFE